MPSAKRYKFRVSAFVALSVLLFCAITVGVSASEPCQRVVKRVVTSVEWPHYTKATVARWVKWGKEHPNYHPPTKRKPVVTTREVEDMVSFACETPAIEQLPPETAMLDEQPPEETLALSFDDNRPYVLEVANQSQPVALLDVPVQAPVLPVSDTPEPQTWLFLLTGVAFLCVVAWKRNAGRGQALIA